VVRHRVAEKFEHHLGHRLDDGGREVVPGTGGDSSTASPLVQLLRAEPTFLMAPLLLRIPTTAADPADGIATPPCSSRSPPAQAPSC
jgi:hypothetical protein